MSSFDTKNIESVNYKKGALDSQPQLIKFTSCLPMVGWFSPDTPTSSTTKTDRHDIVEILLKVGLKHQKSINQSSYSNATVCLSFILSVFL